MGRTSNNIKDYFTFNKSERIGIITLIISITIIISINYTLDYFIIKPKIDFSAFEQKLLLSEKSNQYYIPSSIDSVFHFDPNTIDSTTFTKLGFSPKLTRTILNYRNKIGQFNKKEDLLKIWGMDTLLYEKLEAYINIEQKNMNPKFSEEIDRQPLKKIKYELFEFDPNLITNDDWIRLGFSIKQAESIEKYKSKGGRFYKMDDLKKMYCMNDSVYKRLEPYVKFQNNIQPNIPLVELNSADSLELITIRGIGPSLASRILKFRKITGGFYEKRQLLEVYGLTEETFNKVSSFIVIDPNRIKKININTADFKTINRHPYIDYKTTKSIIEVREFNGSFTNCDELVKFKIIENQIYEKIKYYIDVK
jgi:DNA uptake protein ComE-like DNA-binding protein